MDNEEGGMMGRIDQFSLLLKQKDHEVGRERYVLHMGGFHMSSQVWEHLEHLNVAPVYYTVPFP